MTLRQLYRRMIARLARPNRLEARLNRWIRRHPALWLVYGTLWWIAVPATVTWIKFDASALTVWIVPLAIWPREVVRTIRYARARRAVLAGPFAYLLRIREELS